MRLRVGERPSNTERRVQTQTDVDILMIAVVAGVLRLQLPSRATVSVVTGDGQLGWEGGHQEEILGLVSLGVRRQGSTRSVQFAGVGRPQIQILTKYNSCLTNTFLISKKIFVSHIFLYIVTIFWNLPQDDKTTVLIIPDDVSQYSGGDLVSLTKQGFVLGRG